MGASRPVVRSLFWEMVLNATIPVGCYVAAKKLGASEFAALAVATAFPLVKSVHDLVQRREVDPVAVLVLLGILTGIAATFFGGDPRILLVRESLFTGAFGLACLVSLTFPRPIMFYVSRYFVAGHDPEKLGTFNGRWANPTIRHAHRLITIVWGVGSVGEFALRVFMIYTMPAAVVLVASPIILGLTTIGAVVWTFWYGQRVRARTERGQEGS